MSSNRSADDSIVLHSLWNTNYIMIRIRSEIGDSATIEQLNIARYQCSYVSSSTDTEMQACFDRRIGDLYNTLTSPIQQTRYVHSSDGEYALNEKCQRARDIRYDRRRPRLFRESPYVERLEGHRLIRKILTSRASYHWGILTLPELPDRNWSDEERAAYRFVMEKYGRKFIYRFFGDLGTQDRYVTTTTIDDGESYHGSKEERLTRLFRHLRRFQMSKQCRTISSTNNES